MGTLFFPPPHCRRQLEHVAEILPSLMVPPLPSYQEGTAETHLPLFSTEAPFIIRGRFQVGDHGRGEKQRFVSLLFLSFLHVVSPRRFPLNFLSFWPCCFSPLSRQQGLISNCLCCDRREGRSKPPLRYYTLGPVCAVAKEEKPCVQNRTGISAVVDGVQFREIV